MQGVGSVGDCGDSRCPGQGLQGCRHRGRLGRGQEQLPSLRPASGPRCWGRGASAIRVVATGLGTPEASARVPSACTAELCAVPEGRLQAPGWGVGAATEPGGYRLEGSLLWERPWGGKRRGPGGPWYPQEPIL